MICPSCGTHIPDTSLVCPACHASVSSTVSMPRLQGQWCPSCGSAVGWDDEVCPHCGFPVERAWGAPTPVVAPVPEVAEPPVEEGVVPLVTAEELEAQTQDTRTLPRIESAIPAEHDPDSKVEAQDVMPSRRSLVVAAIASAALICGLAIVITHPWNPDRYSIRATEEADTSMAGFPGTVESLSGQDSNGAPDIEVLSGDDATFAQLDEAYGKLKSYAQRADQSEELFGEVAFGSNLDERTRGKREAEALAIDISNLIAKLDEVDVTSGTYAGDLDHMRTLGSWLRNRVDRLVDAWTADLAADDPASQEQELRAILTADDGQDGANAYKTLFEDNVEGWEPQRREP